MYAEKKRLARPSVLSTTTMLGITTSPIIFMSVSPSSHHLIANSAQFL